MAWDDDSNWEAERDAREFEEAFRAEIDEDPDDPEACPECGCRPGQGYTPGCPACTATRVTLAPDA